MNSSEQFPMLRSIGRALPQNYYPQEMISAALWDEWGGSDESRARFDRLHRSVGVRGRHLAVPMEDYRALDSFAKMNDKWIERASDLGQQAIESALGQAGLGRVVFADPSASRQVDCQRYRIGTVRRRRGRGATDGWRSIRCSAESAGGRIARGRYQAGPSQDSGGVQARRFAPYHSWQVSAKHWDHQG